MKKEKGINLELKVNIIEFSCLFQLPRSLQGIWQWELLLLPNEIKSQRITSPQECETKYILDGNSLLNRPTKSVHSIHSVV